MQKLSVEKKAKYTITAFIGIKMVVATRIKYDCLHKSIWMLAWYIQLCVNTMPRRRDIGSNLRAFVATQQSGSSYEAIFKQFEFYSEKDYSQVSIQEISWSFSSLQIHLKIKKTAEWLQKRRVKVLPMV